MSHGPTRYKTRNRCIYCGADDVPLSDEHIVPLAIGGLHVLEKASCGGCSKITGKFEQDVMRELWGRPRISYSAPTRRKKQRPLHIALPDQHNPGNTFSVPYAEYPAPFIFYKMDRAGCLQGSTPADDLSKAWQLITVMDQKKADEFHARFPGNFTTSFRHVPDSFARMLAKIGYGQALTQLDLEDFRPTCIPYILGRFANLSYIVGGDSTIQDPKPGTGYEMDTLPFGNSERIIIVSALRLIANCSTPSYHAVVGDVVGEENVERVMRKLAPESPPLGPKQIIVPHSEKFAHCMPKYWPVTLD